MSGSDRKGDSPSPTPSPISYIPSWIDNEAKLNANFQKLRKEAAEDLGTIETKLGMLRHVPEGYRNNGKTRKPGKLHEEAAASLSADLDGDAKGTGRFPEATSHLHAAAAGAAADGTNYR